MKGHCILSHGLHSSPTATKVSALARVAEHLGWSHECPDYSDIDTRAGADIRDVGRRLARLLESARAAPRPLVLVGSSMGAYISALASLEIQVVGLFLMAPPVALPGYPRRLAAAAVPTVVIHGWHDELIPAADVFQWCQPGSTSLRLVDDGHRLEHHVDLIELDFARFLGSMA